MDLEKEKEVEENRKEKEVVAATPIDTLVDPENNLIPVVVLLLL